MNPWHVSETFKEITVSGYAKDVNGAGFDGNRDRLSLKILFLGQTSLCCIQQSADNAVVLSFRPYIKNG